MEKHESILNQKRRYASLKFFSEQLQQVYGTKKINLSIQNDEENDRILVVEQDDGKTEEYQIDDCFIIGSFEDIIVSQEDADSDDGRAFLRANDSRIEAQLNSIEGNDKDRIQLDDEDLKKQENNSESFIEDSERRESLGNVPQTYEYTECQDEECNGDSDNEDNDDDQSEFFILDSGDIPNNYLQEILLSEGSFYKKLRVLQEQKQQGHQVIGGALPGLMDNQLRKLKKLVSQIRHTKKQQKQKQQFMDIENEEEEEEKQIKSRNYQPLENEIWKDESSSETQKQITQQKKKKMFILIVSGGEKMKKSIKKSEIDYF